MERCPHIRVTVGRHHTFFTNRGRLRLGSSAEDHALLRIQGRDPRLTSHVHTSTPGAGSGSAVGSGLSVLLQGTSPGWAQPEQALTAPAPLPFPARGSRGQGAFLWSLGRATDMGISKTEATPGPEESTNTAVSGGAVKPNRHFYLCLRD